MQNLHSWHSVIMHVNFFNAAHFQKMEAFF